MSGYRDVPEAPVVVAAFGDNVFGMDPASGRVLWQQPLPFGGGAISLAITPTAIFAATEQGLVCLRYPDGEVLWSQSTKGIGRTSVLVVGTRVFVGKAGEVECYTLDGTRVWHEHFKGKGVSVVALGVPGWVAQADVSG